MTDPQALSALRAAEEWEKAARWWAEQNRDQTLGFDINPRRLLALLDELDRLRAASPALDVERLRKAMQTWGARRGVGFGALAAYWKDAAESVVAEYARIAAEEQGS